MGITYRIQAKAVIIICADHYTHPQFAAVFQEAIQDPNFRPPMSLVVDARQSKANPSLDQIESMVNFLGSFHELLTLRSAIIAAPNSLLYGLGRMYAALSAVKGFTVEIFSRQREALAWLARADDAQQPEPPCRCA